MRILKYNNVIFFFTILTVEQFYSAKQDNSEITAVKFKATLNTKERLSSVQLLCIGPEIV